MQYNLNKYFVKTCDNKAIAVAQHKNNLYEINITEIHIMKITNLVQPLVRDDALGLSICRLSHLNVKSVHTL